MRTSTATATATVNSTKRGTTLQVVQTISPKRSESYTRVVMNSNQRQAKIKNLLRRNSGRIVYESVKALSEKIGETYSNVMNTIHFMKKKNLITCGSIEGGYEIKTFKQLSLVKPQPTKTKPVKAQATTPKETPNKVMEMIELLKGMNKMEQKIAKEYITALVK